MNWDRWQDANWVRWHKLLPEKQGGWAFQTLLAANVLPQLVPGSPALLLHFNFALLPFSAGLLLHMDGTNGATTFPDSSVNALPNTLFGSGTHVTTADEEFGSGSCSFSGAGGLSYPQVAGGPLDISLGDWTVEFWMKAGGQGGGEGTIILAYSDSPHVVNLLIIYNTSAAPFVVCFHGSFEAESADNSVPLNTWTAIALVMHGTTLSIYINGVLSGTSSRATRPTVVTGTFVLGSSSGQTQPYSGLVDELRVTKGIALYTANYTPSAIAFLPTMTALQPSYIDSSLYNWPMTASATAGLDGGNPKFGNGALLLDGATAVVTTPIGLGTPLDLSSGDFTLELWMRSTAAVASVILDASNGHTGGFYISQLGSASIQANIWNGSGYSTITAPVPLNAYKAIALVRQGAVFTLYAGGVSAGSVTIPGSIAAGGTLGIGGGFTTSLTGDIDEVRLTLEALYTANYTPATVENTLGLPNALGVANTPNAFTAATYLGLARDIHDWSSIDGQFWIAIGTHLKLYIVNQATLYDITPQRKTSNLVNALSTVNGSNVVTIADAGHQAATGDFVTVTGASSVAGITLAGNYQIVVLDPSSYTVTASIAAISALTGGGNFSVTYDIGAGLPANGQLLGYGTGPYGIGTYGTPRPAGTGVFARMRTWSLDNYGQDLIASESDGEIYIWARNGGPNSRAIIIPNAPQGCQRVLVDASEQVIIALGCTDVTSVFNACLVRWCSFGNLSDWVPTDVNTAGDDFLVSGSRIVTALKTKGQNLIWTDTTLYRMQFVGEPDIYDFYPAGEVAIVGPNAAVDVDGVAYFMGFDNFYNYSGTLMLQACETWETVFDPTLATSINKAQTEGVVCFTFEPKTEITWLYQSIGGAFTVAFTAPVAQGAVGATLSTPWSGATGLYDLQFSDQEAQVVSLTKGSSAASWVLPLTGSVGASALFVGNDRYATFNWEDGIFYCGAWNRTCAQGRSNAMGGYPYGVNAGYLYQHEIGTDAIEAAGTVALPFFMRSLDITIGGAKSEYTMGGSDARFAIGGSDSHLLVRSILPDWKYFTGQMQLTLLTKDRPQQATYTQSGPVIFDSTFEDIDIDAHGSQLVIQMDNLTGPGGVASLGCSFRMGIFQGLATPYAKR